MELEIMNKLIKDMREAQVKLTSNEARYFVDMYYQVQEYRKAIDSQIRSIEQPVYYDEQGKKRQPTQEEIDNYVPEPHDNMHIMSDIVSTLENRIKVMLDVYTDNHPIGQWLKSITGIGPVIAAGLLAHIDIAKAPTAGHIWSFAGLNPKQRWLGSDKAKKLINDILEGSKEITEDILREIADAAGRNPESLKGLNKKDLISLLAKRPWNASLKTLCWKIGESFVKVSNNPRDVYGHLYRQRKEMEESRNANKEYAGQAARILKEKNIGKTTEAYKWYSKGMLPPAHINQRAKRWAVKIFLSHLHEHWYRQEFKKEPPAPYPIAILGHAHKIKKHA